MNEEITSTNIEKEKTVADNKNDKKFIIHLMIDFRDVCIVSAALPLITLLLCFVTACVFQAEEVHETHCRVYNIIPSISAITGVSPQRYFWRISIAFHIGPRLPIAAVYRNYYRSLLINVKPENHNYATNLINLIFWLHVIEIGSLCGVTYISNRENYPLHEKIFITFMVVSLCHMLASIKLYELLHPKEIITETQQKSLKYKKILFIVSIVSTIGLIIFFLKHRLLCHDMAFSWFAFCEYIIATSNIGFHCTTILDFTSQQFLVAQGAYDQIKKDQNIKSIQLKTE